MRAARRPSLPRTPLRRSLGWCVGWLLLALVAMQTLGVMHKVVHGGAHEVGQGLAHEAAQEAVHEAEHAHAGHSHSTLLALFSGHGSGVDCQLFDQTSHGDALAWLAAPLPTAPAPVFLRPYVQGEAVARWPTLFDARGPPSLR